MGSDPQDADFPALIHTAEDKPTENTYNNELMFTVGSSRTLEPGRHDRPFSTIRVSGGFGGAGPAKHPMWP